MKPIRICFVAALAAAIGVGLSTTKATAQAPNAVEDFYRGKQVRMIIRSNPGGGYDLYARLLARYIGSHIPGKPAVIPQNMPGAGGIVAINYVANVAPSDGTALTIISSALVFDQALGLTPTLKVDLKAMNWIGNLLGSNILSYVWHTSPVKTMDDARKFEAGMGSTGAGDVSSWIPLVYNKVLGTKFKVVEGYRSSSDVKLAMERGEIAGIGSNPLSSLMTIAPDWIRDKKVSVLAQIGVRREPMLPDVPLITELARNKEEGEILGFISKALAIGRPFGVHPDVPKDRVAALRAAFDATVVDPAFIEFAKKQGADLGPIPGVEVQQLVRDVIGAPEDLKAKVTAILPPRK